jgi:hypothetical protein
MHRCAFFALLVGGTLAVTGCGPSLVKVSGVVKLDGTPVEGATVSFVSEDGKNTFAGFTDSGGNFTLSAGDKPGAQPGTYKVVVVKSPKSHEVADADPGGADYMKMMKEKTKEAPAPGPKVMMPGMKGGGSKGGGGPARKQSELPSMYASAQTTPIKVTVPPDTHTIELQSK